MTYTMQKHLQNVLIGCISGMLVGVFFGLYGVWGNMEGMGVWVVLVPIFVTMVYFLIILYPTYWACKYLNKKDKELKNKK